MRLSISTKIFLGFFAVIIAFGGVGVYGLFRIEQIRRNVQLVRKGVLPLAGELESLLRELEVYSKELERTHPAELLLLRSYFPSFKPFEGVERVEERIARLLETFPVEEAERRFLAELRTRMGALRTGTDFRDRDAQTETLLAAHPEAQSNAEVYRLVAQSFLATLHAEDFNAARPLQDRLSSIIRRVRHETAGVRRETRRFMTRIDRRSEASEAETIMVIGAAGGLALVIAVAVMLVVALTLRPIRRLREGARRIAQGEFAPVDIRTGDEIGQLAEEFNRMADQLARRQQQLEAQGRELVRAERLATIGKMSSQITHEIRNPLSSMGLNAELLEEEISLLDLPPDGEARVLLRAIRGEIDRLGDVAEQYLRYARLPKASLAMESLNGLVEDVVSFVREEIAAQGVTLELHLGPDLPLVPLDEGQLRQVLLNLIRNALEATEGPGRIEVVTARDGAGVRLEVADTGTGIPTEARDRIFDPFFSTKVAGTGLGLPLVQQIATEHGGRVTCDSTPGHGARFVLWLPLEASAG